MSAAHLDRQARGHADQGGAHPGRGGRPAGRWARTAARWRGWPAGCGWRGPNGRRGPSRHAPGGGQDSARVGPTETIGIDETAFLKAKPRQATRYVTGVVDLAEPKLIDLLPGNGALDVRHWRSQRDEEWVAGVTTVACDLHEGFRSGLSPISLTSARWPPPSTWVLNDTHSGDVLVLQRH